MFIVFALAASGGPVLAADPTDQREAFSEAWEAARKGDRETFDRIRGGLQGYLLFPYLHYEDLRHRRARVDEQEMADFLSAHQDWAFTAGLETAWLQAQGRRGKWNALLRHGAGSGDTLVRCYRATAGIERGQTEGLLSEAKALWTVGQSQPDACDPVFKWLRQQDGITPGLAWERIRLAMEAREPRLTRYLARYLEESERVWADRWYRQDRAGYRKLRRSLDWPDEEKSRDIVDFGLRRLARSEPDLAWDAYRAIEAHFDWSETVEGAILRELALWSAVNHAPDTLQRMNAVPAGYRDDRLLEWRVRHALTVSDWQAVSESVEMMSSDKRDDTRWRYWRAMAMLNIGDRDQGKQQLSDLARETSYYGFLAADRLELPYTICPLEPGVDEKAVQALYRHPGIERALELRRAGLPGWARREWSRVLYDADRDGLRVAAAVATRENWPDMAIAALGNSGDLRWYAWRFPVAYEPLVQTNAGSRDLDPSWIFGLMRSESAMAEDAVSSAGARGLMQVMPQTARRIAKRHAYVYTDSQQLMQAEDNIVFGTTYLRELMDRFANNPVLASGAYNAGPQAVDRWLGEGYTGDPAIWVDTLPYYETRDYIPRVLAFSTIYDWRRQRPVIRVTSRMPALDGRPDGAAFPPPRTTEVVCRVSG